MEKKIPAYVFNRMAFDAGSFHEADNHCVYWSQKSLKERLEAGSWLSMQMFGCNKFTPINKNVFDKRKHPND